MPDVAISGTVLRTQYKPINMVHPEFSMVIAIVLYQTALLEIATSLRASQ